MLSFSSYLIETFDIHSINNTPVVYVNGVNRRYLPNTAEESRFRFHTYTFPTFHDIATLRKKVKTNFESGDFEVASDFKKVLDDIYSPKHVHFHSGRLRIEEDPNTHGVADISFSESGKYTRYLGTDVSREPLRLPTSAAFHTFRHVAAAIKHFKNLPVRPWSGSELSKSLPLSYATPHAVIFDTPEEYHKVTNANPDGSYILKGTTDDWRKHRFYGIVAAKLGDIWSNEEEGVPIEPRDERIPASRRDRISQPFTETQ